MHCPIDQVINGGFHCNLLLPFQLSTSLVSCSSSCPASRLNIWIEKLNLKVYGIGPKDREETFGICRSFREIKHWITRVWPLTCKIQQSSISERENHYYLIIKNPIKIKIKTIKTGNLCGDKKILRIAMTKNFFQGSYNNASIDKIW